MCVLSFISTKLKNNCVNLDGGGNHLLIFAGEFLIKIRSNFFKLKIARKFDEIQRK